MSFLADFILTPAFIGSLIVGVVAVGVSVGVSLLLKPNLRTPVRDQAVETQVERGAIIPYVIGKRRVGPVVCWVGRLQFNNTTPGGGNKGFGGKHSKTLHQRYNNESAWHVIAIGPIKKLHAIYVAGRKVFTGPVDAVGLPSGSTISIGDGGECRWYWGEYTQPVEAILAAASSPGSADDGVGIASAWPGICYCVWSPKALGNYRQWPIIEYEVESEIQYSGALTGSSKIEFTTVAPDPIVDVSGVNPAHAMYQLLFGEFPHGLALDPAEWDIDSLQDVADTCAAEKLASSYLITQGDEAAGAVAEVLQDIGGMIGWNPAVGKHYFKLIRSGDTDVKTIPAELVQDPLPEIENVIAAINTDRLVFAYPDEDREFRLITIVVDEDGQASFLENQRAKKVQINSTVNFYSARTIAERRSQETLAGGTRYVIKTARGARTITPGQALMVEGLPQLLRVGEVDLDVLQNTVVLACLADYYGAPAATFKALATTGGAVAVRVTAPDLAQEWYEVPSQLIADPTGGISLIAPRIRADKGTASAEIYLSPDGTTYTAEGSEDDLQTGGTLVDAMAADGPEEIEVGPEFTVLGPDIAFVAKDLSSDHASWRLGKQLCVIGQEFFYLRNVEALGGTSYKLKGLIRARFDTHMAAHAPGATVYIFNPTEIKHTEDAMLAPKKSISMKIQVTGFAGSIPLGTVPAITHTLHGKGLVPMDPLNVRTIGGSPSYPTGEDIPLKWDYKSTKTAKTGAGFQPAGDPAPDPSAVDGKFEVKFFTLADVLKKTVTGLTTPDYTYLNADLVADFGGEVDFKVEVKNIKGGYKSDPALLTVEAL